MMFFISTATPFFRKILTCPLTPLPSGCLLHLLFLFLSICNYYTVRRHFNMWQSTYPLLTASHFELFLSFLSFLHPKSLSSSDLPLMFFHLLNLFILSSHIHNPSHSPKHTHRNGINHFRCSYRSSSFKQTTFCTPYFSTSSIYQGNLNPLMQ